MRTLPEVLGALPFEQRPDSVNSHGYMLPKHPRSTFLLPVRCPLFKGAAYSMFLQHNSL